MTLTTQLLKELGDSLGSLKAVPECDILSDDSMTTQVGISVDTTNISLLVLMMHELLSCIALAPMATVHVRYTYLFEKLSRLEHLLHPKIDVTTDQIIEVLILHQSIIGLIRACPHTFIVARLEEYMRETKGICESLGKQYAKNIIENHNTSVIVDTVTVVETV